MGYTLKQGHIYFLFINLCCFLNSCDSNTFYKFESEELSYQLYTSKNEILRVVNRNDNAAFSLEIFDNNANLLSDITIAPYAPIIMSKLKNNELEISYIVGKSDLKFFLPWLKTSKFNSRKIGNYNISYSYIIDNGFGINIEREIDSFDLKNSDTVDFFLKNRFVDRVPIASLLIYSNKLSRYDIGSCATTDYHVAKENFIQNLLKGIVSSL